MTTRYVGIDLGIATAHRAAVVDAGERRGKPFQVEVSRKGFEELLQRATEGAEGPAKLVVEPTGLAWVPLAAYMIEAGQQVHVVKPQKVAHLRKFLKQHTKSDSVDAETLARLPQIDPDGVHEVQLPTAKQMSLRRLVKRRQRLAEEAADQKRRIHALMVMVNPPLMSALAGSAFSEAARALFRKHADPATVVKIGREKLKKFWTKHRGGGSVDDKLIDRVYQACSITSELFAPLRQSGKLPFDYADVQEELRAELDWMEQAEREVQLLETQIEALYDRCDPDHTLEQIRGVGTIIAASIEAIVGNISRFHNGRQFVSYCGLCPRKKQSGQNDRPMPMTKCGQRLLKKYLYLAADVARQYDAEFGAYYGRRYARGDHHNRIMIALARKMALRVYALLKRRQQARQDGAAQPAAFVLRDPQTGAVVDKKQARQLVVEKYTRSLANSERHKQDSARRGKPEGAGPAKKEWPSKDATSKHATPSPLITHAEHNGNGADKEHHQTAKGRSEAIHVIAAKGTRRGGGWMSLGEVLEEFYKNMTLENTEDFAMKTCEDSPLADAKSAQKRG